MNQSEKNLIESKLKEQIYQKWYNKPTKYILHVGPTNSGKTYNAVQRLKEASKGIYLAPLRLLAWEIYEKMGLDGVLCSLFTGEEKIAVQNSTVSSCTIEMCNTEKHYDIVVVDECFMIADKQRGKFWLDAIMGVNADEVHIITNLESRGLIEDLLSITGNFYTVQTYERKIPLEISERDINLKKLDSKTILVTFSRINVLYQKYLLQQLGIKCSILYGNLPPEVKKDQIRAFVDGETQVLVTTDVIGMGINLPCNQIVFLEDSKFDGQSMRKLNEKEIKQISGRAGRYGLSNKGIVTALDPLFIEDIKAAFESNIEEEFGVYGLDGEIYKILPEKTPNLKVKAFKELKFIPQSLSFLKIEDLEKYTPLLKHYELSQLNDDFAWAFLSCPVNSNNLGFWKDAVSSTVYNKTINFNEKYSTTPFDDVRLLEYAERDIANIDLCLYMFNNKTLNPLFAAYNTDFMQVLKSHKDIIIDNINDFLLRKKIQKKQDKSQQRRPKKSK